MDKNIGKGIALVALSATAYGFMPIFAKMAYASGASTHTFLLLRFSVASLLMLVLVRAKGLALPPARQSIPLLLLGAITYFGQSFLYFSALQYASPPTVALLLYTYPALVMAGSAVFLKERITRTKVLSLVLALIGAFVIVGTGFAAEPVGIGLAVLAALCYASYILLSSRVSVEGAAMQSSALIMLGATASYVVVGFALGFEPPREASGWAAVALVAVVSTVVAFWSFLAGMELTGPTTAALVSTLEPVVTVLASIVLLSERLTMGTVLGGCLVVAALLVTAVPLERKA